MLHPDQYDEGQPVMVEVDVNNLVYSAHPKKTERDQ